MNEILESPVPYIIGVQRMEREKLHTFTECLVVDCNTKNVAVPTVFPPLPLEAKL